MKVLAIVPARCGSKGFPNKNIMKISDTTLLELAVNIGVKSNYIDDVYVSTDCIEYEKIALKAGAKSLGLRPAKLATDSSKSIDVVIDLLQSIQEEYKYVVLLQPTSPLREPDDIKCMIELMQEKDVDASVSISRLEEPHPYKLKSITHDGYVESFMKGKTSEVPRQSLPKVYALNGAIYISKTEVILREKTFLPKKTLPYIIEENINIDTEIDFLLLKTMYENNKINIFGMKNEKC